MALQCPHGGVVLVATACPVDRNPLALRAHADAFVLRCDACCGVWMPPRVVAAAVGHVPHPARRGAKPHPTRCCPKDGAALHVVMAHGVEIDVCAGCGGVWLDDGELERIARLRRGQEPGPASRVAEGTVYAVDAANAAGQVATTASGAAETAAAASEVVASGALDAMGSALEFIGSALSIF